MTRRGGPKKPPVADFHLWEDVTATVTPLGVSSRRRARLADAPLPLPPAVPPSPKRVRTIAMPSYQSPGRPGAPQAPSLEPKLRRRVGRGRIEIDGTLDLHGMRQHEAEPALHRFIAARAARGDRTLLIITGKGLKKVDGDAGNIVERGVLRSMLPLWLAAPDIAPLVAGWDPAHQTHGGDGAFYVRLRREARR
jgi:DNA-nicking Smr family endonuclease